MNGTACFTEVEYRDAATKYRDAQTVIPWGSRVKQTNVIPHSGQRFSRSRSRATMLDLSAASVPASTRQRVAAAATPTFTP
jgi:molybdopterin biosynthesis enzyme